MPAWLRRIDKLAPMCWNLLKTEPWALSLLVHGDKISVAARHRDLFVYADNYLGRYCLH